MTKKKVRIEMRLATKDVVKRWRDRVCRRWQQVDPGEAFVWQGVWTGFVTALGRDDLANYEAYMELGYPHEWESIKEADSGKAGKAKR
jgi:hypothetical protein